MLLAATYVHTILAFLFGALACVLILVVLLQRGRGGGLASAFGGAGGYTAFGAKTGDFLTWVTIAGAALFLLLSIFLNYVFVPSAPDLPGKQLESEENPAEAPVPQQSRLDPGRLPTASLAEHAIFGVDRA